MKTLLPSTSRGRVVCLITLIAIFFLDRVALAANWADHEEQLATRIVAVTGPGTMAVDFVNRSSLTRTEVEEIRRGLLARLATRGARFVGAEQAVAEVKVSLSEDLQNYIWVAEVRQGTNESPAILISFLRADASAAEVEPAPLALHKALLLRARITRLGEDQWQDARQIC